MVVAMKRMFACLAFLPALSACVSGDGGWQRTDGKPYSVGDSSQCMGEAQAQTRSQYPDQIVQAGGAEIRVPKSLRLSRRVAGLLPEGLDYARLGLPRDLLGSTDPVALMDMYATAEAFVSAGLQPEELLQHVHPAKVANTQGSGIGGMKSLHRLYVDPVLGRERQTDALQETLVNVTAAYAVQSYVGSYGAMAHPVGA